MNFLGQKWVPANSMVQHMTDIIIRLFFLINVYYKSRIGNLDILNLFGQKWVAANYLLDNLEQYTVSFKLLVVTIVNYKSE